MTIMASSATTGSPLTRPRRSGRDPGGSGLTGLALASLRRRLGSFVATFLSAFLGTAIVSSFAAMLDTGLGHGVAGSDRTTLMIIAGVVGGWGTIIVAAAVAATVAVSTRQRAAELALLRAAGATPDQVTALITRETAVVAGLAALLAMPAGYGGGRLLLAMLQDTHQVSPHIHYRFGPAAVGIGLVVGLFIAVLVTRVTARRAARRRVVEALSGASSGGQRMSRTRLWAGIICLAIGVDAMVLSLTIVSGKNVYGVQAIAAEACIWSGIGFALLAPVLLRAALAVLGAALRAVAGTVGELAVAGMRQRLQQAATPLMPVIVVTSMATGTLYMQAITNSLHAPGADKSVEMLNYVIVAMLSVFAAVMLVNLLVVTLADRRREFAQQRLVGATRRQLLGLVTAENGVLLLAGLVFGTIGALLTILPFSVKTAHRAVPHAPIWIYLVIVAVVSVLTIGTSLAAAWRATRPAAIMVLREAARI
jgi:putative ABC transport system permease protein